MGERKGVNKYYPPDFDPQKHRSLDKYHGTHPLRERAKKIHLGILVIRYEMPYNVWCGGCGIHIGMGVRYNAEKKKVGNYYTTPIYQFKMKCHLCENYLVMETDPKNCEYKCISGVRRKNQKWDMEENEQIVPEDKEELKKRAADSMSQLEHGVNDKKKSTLVMPTLGQLADHQSGWRDDYQQNSMLRHIFRTEKKKVEASNVADAQLLAKSSLDIELVAETEQDKELAALMKYSVVQSFDEKQKQKREQIESKPLFFSKKSQPSKQSDKSKRNESLIEKLGNKVLKSVSGITFGASNKRHHTMLDIGVRKKKTADCDTIGRRNGEIAVEQEEKGTEQEEKKTIERKGRTEIDLKRNSSEVLEMSEVSEEQQEINNISLESSEIGVDRQTDVQSTELAKDDMCPLQNTMGILCDYGSSSGEEV